MLNRRTIKILERYWMKGGVFFAIIWIFFAHFINCFSMKSVRLCMTTQGLFWHRSQKYFGLLICIHKPSRDAWRNVALSSFPIIPYLDRHSSTVMAVSNSWSTSFSVVSPSRLSSASFVPWWMVFDALSKSKPSFSSFLYSMPLSAYMMLTISWLSSATFLRYFSRLWCVCRHWCRACFGLEYIREYIAIQVSITVLPVVVVILHV